MFHKQHIMDDVFWFLVWEISTGRCVRTIAVGGTVRGVSWCPNVALSLVAVVADRKCLLINPNVGDKLVIEKTDTVLLEPPAQVGQGGVMIQLDNQLTT